MALRIDIKGHISDLRAKLSQAGNALNKFSQSVKSKMAAVGTQVLASLAGAFALHSIKTQITSLIDEMDKIGKASDRLGVSTKAYQEMAFAAKLAGVTMERFTLAMSALGPFMLNAANGASRQAKALKVLNVDYAELSKMAPEKQFNTITKAIDELANATERVGISRLIFGRAGFEVLGMAANMEAAKKRIEDGIISEKDIRAAEDFNDTLAAMSTKLKAVAANSGALRAVAEILKNFEGGGAGALAQAARLDPVTGPFMALGGLIGSNATIANLQKSTAEEIDKLNKGGPGDAARRAADRQAANVAEAFAASTGGGGMRERFRVDQLRRIGALPGAGPGTGDGPILSMATNLEKLVEIIPPIAQAATAINLKTPPPNKDGKF
jgi:hypothetical protein